MRLARTYIAMNIKTFKELKTGDTVRRKDKKGKGQPYSVIRTLEGNNVTVQKTVYIFHPLHWEKFNTVTEEWE